MTLRILKIYGLSNKAYTSNNYGIAIFFKKKLQTIFLLFEY